MFMGQEIIVKVKGMKVSENQNPFSSFNNREHKKRDKQIDIPLKKIQINISICKTLTEKFTQSEKLFGHFTYFPVNIGSSSIDSSRGSIMDNLTFDPHATRTVFVGNLDKIVTHGELRNIFERFGEVVVSFFFRLHLICFKIQFI